MIDEFEVRIQTNESTSIGNRFQLFICQITILFAKRFGITMRCNDRLIAVMI